GQLTRRRPERRHSRRNNRSSQRDEEDRLVSELREQNVPWRDVAERVNTEFGGNNNPSCLQMRMTRRRRRMQDWSEDDVSTCDPYRLVSLSQPHNILPLGYRFKRFRR